MHIFNVKPYIPRWNNIVQKRFTLNYAKRLVTIKGFWRPEDIRKVLSINILLSETFHVFKKSIRWYWNSPVRCKNWRMVWDNFTISLIESRNKYCWEIQIFACSNHLLRESIHIALLLTLCLVVYVNRNVMRKMLYLFQTWVLTQQSFQNLKNKSLLLRTPRNAWHYGAVQAVAVWHWGREYGAFA